MKDLIKKKDLSESMVTFFFLALFFYPIYPNNLKPTIVVAFCVSSIFYVLKHREAFSLKNKQLNKLFFINSGVFCILLISLLYTKDFERGADFIFRMLPLILFPLSFRIISNSNLYSEELTNRAFKFFYLATVVLFIGYMAYFYFNGNINQFFLRDYNERINTKLGKYSIHPIYASIYLCLALIISIRLYTKKMLNKKVIAILNALLILELILLSRKSTIILMSILFLFYLFYHSKLKLGTKWMMIAILTATFFSVLYLVPDISKRFNEFKDLATGMNSRSSISLRYNIYNCSFDSIMDRPFLGHGLGSEKQVLLDCYKENKRVFNGNFYNTHNQYLSVWLSSGIIGFLSLLALILYSFIISIKSRDFIFIGTLTLFAFLMLIENILERQEGVILFSLFINSLSFTKINKTIGLNK
ncbi:O-antigen ligase family protein [Winogradskyella sp. HB-48]|uniref:O-antigen ligase family protein n=1 Tax=Winogradskyella sp. HB-48 TaxID=3416808 RepID=UPI003CEB511C